MAKLNITPKLTLVFILFAVILLLGLSVPVYSRSRAALLDATLAEFQSTSLEKQSALEAWIEERLHGINDIANQPHLQEHVATFMDAPEDSLERSAGYDDLVTELAHWAGEEHRFLNLSLIDAQSGQIIASTDPNEEGKYRESQPYFINGKQGPNVQNPFYDLSLRRPIMTAAAPVFSPEGELIAVLAGPLNMDDVNEIIQRRTSQHQTDDVYLVNHTKLLVTQPRLIPDPAVLQRGLHTEAVTLCLDHNSGVIEADDYRGVPTISVYRWLPERELCLITEIDQDEAFAPARALGKTMTVIGGLILFIGSIAAIIISNSVAKPILKLVQSVEQIGQGNLDQRIEISSKDEIGLLGREFNHMAAAVAEKETQLLAWGNELELRVDERTVKLKESEERYRILSETSPDMIFVIGRDDHIQYVNNRAAGQFGKTPDQVIGKPRSQLFPASIADSQGPGLQQVLKSGQPLTSESPITFPGGKLWLDTQLVPLRDETGEVSAVMGVSRDITERKQTEETQAEQHAFLRQVLDISPNPLFVRDEKGYYTMVNRAMAEFSGTTVDDLIGTKDKNINLSPDLMNKFIEEDRTVLDTAQGEFILNEEMISPKGEKCWVQVHKQPLISSNGKADQVLVALVDVTERILAEEAQAKQHAFLRQVLDIIPNPIFVRDREGNITMANKSIADFYGTTVDELIGTQDVNQNLDSEQVDHHRAEDHAVMDSLQGVFILDEKIITPDGETYYWQIHKQPLISSSGTADQVLVALVDVTQRKLAEEAQAVQHAFLRQVLDIVPNQLFVRNRKGFITLANRAMAEFYDTTVDKLEGTQDVNHRWSIEQVNKFRAEDCAVMDSCQEVFTLNEEIISPRGEKCWVQVHKKPLIDSNGKADQVLIALIDVTERRLSEKRIREEKALSDSIINSLPGIFYLFDAQGKFLSWNKNFEEVSGYSTEEMLERHPSDFFVGEDQQSVAQTIQEVFVEGESRVEAQFVSKSGESTPYYLTGVRVELNEQPYVSGSGIETTAIKQAEEALQAAKDYAENLIETANAMVVALDDEGRVQTFNKAAERISGYKKSDMVDRNWFEVMTPRDRYPEVWDEFERLMEGGMPKFFENPILTKAGLERHISWSNSEVIEKGKVVGVISFGQDITERKLAEEELLLKDIVFDSSIAANSIAGNDGVITHVNPAFLQLWGYETTGDAIGNPVSSFFVNEEDAIPVITALNETGSWSGEFLAKKTSGATFISQGFATVVQNKQGEQIGYQSGNLDMTDQKEAEKQLNKANDDLARSNAELERFAYVASHDLQEPLRMVTSYLQLLERRYKDKLDGDALEFINYAVDGSSRMKTLINDLLAFSRVGTHGLDFSQTDCETVMKNVLNNLQIVIEETKTRITHDPLPQVTADAGQIQQLLQNLVANAIKFHGENSPLIHVGVKQNEKYWVFSVKDNGIGIDPQYFERIFVIFQRLHNNEEYSGTGIGLAVGKRIVERHGGRIWIESKSGNGSTFFFTLPKTGAQQ
jgi:PAS domain S-box-containing protein